MRIIYQIAILVCTIVSFTSCEKDIKVDVPEMKEGLTLFSHTETGTPMTVVVGKSMSILRYTNRSEMYVTNATVKLYVNGTFVQTLEYEPTMNWYFSTVDVEPGKRYKLVVEAPGFTTVEAEAEAPGKVPAKLQYIADTTIANPFGGGMMMATAVAISFDDPAGADYYQLNFYTADQLAMGFVPEPSQECLNIKDPSIDPQLDVLDGGNCVSGDVVFNDDLFSGKNKQIMTAVSPFTLSPIIGEDTILPAFKITRISEARYRYVKSYKKARDTDGNPFAEPVNVYTNVKNGHGIFSIVNPEWIYIKHF